MTKTVAALPPVTGQQRDFILTSHRNAVAHAELMAEIPAMTSIEVGGTARFDVIPRRFTAAAWNVERCLFPEPAAIHINHHRPAIVLLSEMDNGMARTGQRNTIADMATEMRMTYAYGVEFYEMDLGGPTERPYCRDEFNAFGWHGNGILSSVPFEDLALIRLDLKGHWFSTGSDGAGDPDQPRLGGRMAVAAMVPTEAGPICVVATHLESNCGTEMRHAQFQRLLDEVELFAPPGAPILIGGDLNTGNHLPPDFDWQRETLFDMARARGFDWSASPKGVTTQASLISPHEHRKMRLDWFCTRGMGGAPHALRVPKDPDGTPLSDHFAISADFRL